MKKIRIIFDYRMIDAYQCQQSFRREDVHKIKKIISFENNKPIDGLDFAILKLKAKRVEGGV